MFGFCKEKEKKKEGEEGERKRSWEWNEQMYMMNRIILLLVIIHYLSKIRYWIFRIILGFKFCFLFYFENNKNMMILVYLY